MPETSFDPKTHRYYAQGRRVTGITEAMRLSGLKPEVQFQGRNHQANFKYAGERGLAVHKMCELDDTGKAHLFDFDQNLLGFLESWRAFKADYQFVPDVVEEYIVHPVYQFGGIPDTAGQCGLLKCYAVVERKVRDLDPADEFQTAAQAILLKDVKGKPVAAEVLVRLFPDGKYKAVKCTMPARRSLILAGIAVANWRIANGGA